MKKDKIEQLTKHILVMSHDSFAIVDLIDMDRRAMAGSILATRREDTLRLMEELKKEDPEFVKNLKAWQSDIDAKVKRVQDSFMPKTQNGAKPNYMGEK